MRLLSLKGEKEKDISIPFHSKGQTLASFLFHMGLVLGRRRRRQLLPSPTVRKSQYAYRWVGTIKRGPRRDETRQLVATAAVHRHQLVDHIQTNNNVNTRKEKKETGRWIDGRMDGSISEWSLIAAAHCESESIKKLRRRRKRHAHTHTHKIKRGRNCGWDRSIINH